VNLQPFNQFRAGHSSLNASIRSIVSISCRNADDVPESWHIKMEVDALRPNPSLITKELSL